MNTSLPKRTINLLLASSIALTPFAANLVIAANGVNASGIELVSFHNEIYKKLTASDIADIKVAYNNVGKLKYEDITKILGTGLNGRKTNLVENRLT